jgi:predicted enzyme related to lactoylglutathione lyase
MTTRLTAPTGAPCWADLWTSDVEGGRRFYAELFGWEAGEPSAEHGGYFMFFREGAPVAGAMGPMGDTPADNRWKAYLATDDITRTVKEAEAAGGQVLVPPVPVDDLGSQAVLLDRTGAVIGAWQPGSFPGFTTLAEPGAPSWFELFTGDHPAALDFYSTVFGWRFETVGDTDEFRYSVMKDPAGDGELAGVMDASAFLEPGAEAHWSVYWQVDDVDASLAKVASLGGSVVAGRQDTPYGTLAVASDPAGAVFKLRTPPAA